MPFHPSNSPLNPSFLQPALSPSLSKLPSVKLQSLSQRYPSDPLPGPYSVLLPFPLFKYSPTSQPYFTSLFSTPSRAHSSSMDASNEERIGSNGGGSKSSSFLCRQSSTRWIPTSDQIRILRDLYYNTGLRSPSAEQIQRISAKLRQYGKIEGKNVFYWFQNHKARERQKKRLTVDLPTNNSNTIKCTTAAMSPGMPPACSSPGLCGGGQMGSSGFGAAGSGLMERSFRESFVNGGGGEAASMESGMGRMGFETGSTPWMPAYQYYTEEQEGEQRPVETLPLFPINNTPEQEEQGEQYDGCCLPAFYWPKHDQEEGHHYVYNAHHHHHTDGGASLELTLNSYHCAPSGSA